MQRNAKTIVVSTATGLLAVVALAGCSSGPAPSVTRTVTASATPGSSASGTPSAAGQAAPSPGATPTGTGGAADGSGTTCTVSSLAGGTEAGSGGAAGSTIIHLTLRNTGSTTCTLQGWPGVSFVGDGDGTQIGAAATQDRSSAHPTVTLGPGQIAVAPLKIANAQNFSNAACSPVAADGFRVYPPGSTESLFVRASGYTACAESSAALLDVQGLVPEGQATD
ncbi:DUF4232 domain-containing protein [Curtobacterium sp. Csp2]|uniref:DUF4232 domain-containing protein n=1 Tax=Curtobacterium sp. Csp2 TaxID=2495430 RepID=UPI001580BA13|nr:DUF4232 domain-containing protein [Curtobacterium sp. Csp2]QKS17965.1 DUF4232 domain-containing protein [Curtobacterium sp. Csp2]